MSFLKDKYLALTIGGIEIDLSRSDQNSVKNLLAVIRGSQSSPVIIDKNLVTSISAELGDVFPEGLSLTINDVLAAKTGNSKVLSASLGVKVGLSELPLVGSMIPSDAQFSIQDFSLLGATSVVNKTSTGYLNDILPPGIDPFPEILNQGINFSAIIKVGDEKLALGVSGLKQHSSQNSNPSNNGITATSRKNTKAKVNKSFGPIHIQAITMDFSGGSLNLILDASIAFGPLSLGFMDLELGSPLSDFNPKASLKGLSLNYRAGDFSIGGAFLNEGAGEYSGMFTLGLAELEVTAFGSYAENNGNPSLFIYGLLDEPLGGPPFFFVEGLAIAFGYNRNFIAPPVSGISTFPLVSAALKPPTKVLKPSQSTGAMLQTLDKYIPVQSGEYFVGLGVKFMSFRVINSFALLIGKFGKELEFDILGATTYMAPNPEDPDPISIVELEIIGSYKPAEGSLLVRGQLTSNSFVLSRKCHLQGGFAVGFWTGGPFAGDFVYSFGGYGSQYQPAPHYPQNIPQLGFLWQVDSDVSIKGGGYWAITPQEIVAGGYLRAAYRSSWVRASFDIDAHFLIQWSPLHYEASFNVTFSLHVKVDLLFVSGWLGFTLSEGLSLHGPPFGGRASISLAVAKVHINFGADPAPKPLLSWSQFQKAFFPKPKSDNSSSTLSINIEKGLVKKELDLVSNKEIYFVNPKELHISTSSFVPCTDFSINLSGQKNSSVGDLFTIPSMGVDFTIANKNTSTHSLSISNDDGQFIVVGSDPKPAPISIWEQINKDGKIVIESDDDKLSPLVFGTEITPAPKVPPSCTSEVPRSKLANELFKGNSFNWQKVEEFTEPQSVPAASIKPGNMDGDIFTYLSEIFSISGPNASDFDGLSNRLQNMKGTKIFQTQLSTV